jgi:DNA-binding response OmpR family regulator
MILDIMMPRMEGMEACAKIHQRQWMPIIMLTAKTGDLDKIQGLAVYNNTNMVHIRKIREKIEDDPKNPGFGWGNGS